MTRGEGLAGCIVRPHQWIGGGFHCGRSTTRQRELDLDALYASMSSAESLMISTWYGASGDGSSFVCASTCACTRSTAAAKFAKVPSRSLFAK